MSTLSDQHVFKVSFGLEDKKVPTRMMRVRMLHDRKRLLVLHRVVVVREAVR
jgi:hypothetical protein